ncbi:hypothetical protein ACP275_04G182300 [Erythranthe tilingii]
MAEAAVTFLLETVTEILKYYADLIAGAEGELQELQKELELLKACLKEAAEMPEKGPHFRVIEKMMREIIYDVEDTLDICLTDASASASAAAAKSKKKLFGRRKAQAALRAISMAEKVKSLREMVKPIYEKATIELENMKNRRGSSSGAGEESRTIVKKDLTIRQDKVVGFEDEEAKIVGFLTEQRKELDVISIIGMPGLGKTTLTWKIYDSDAIQRAYRIRIWVNVSQKFNKKELLLNILKEFTGEDMSNKGDFELEQAVRKCLKDEKFLIVLDDVWNVEDWKTIKKVLPMINGLGKVIITSRFDEVGTSASIRGPYKLRFLTKDESWKLLQLEVFEDVGICPPELITVGEQVAHNCDGLPLTIVVIGGILVAQFSRQRPIGVIKNEWIKVSENVIQFAKTDKKNHISNVVGLSYDILPDELKECFIYMGVFPEDHEIPAWTLTRLWIAEGFIQQKEGQSLEETAEEYLNDLINRNLLMVGRINPMGENKTCSVHDVIHLFCITKAAEQNLFQEIKTSSQGVSLPPIPATEKYHRLCFSSDLSKFLSEGKVYPSVRSFLSFYKDLVELKPEYITSIPDAFKLLRVLNSNSIRFHQFPLTVTELCHLRYVTLYVHNLTVIPESISKLWNLQTLLVETNSNTVSMNGNLWSMVRLRHLKTKAAMVLDQEQKGNAGENIQTLSTLSPESCTEIVAKNARNVKELRVRGNLDTLFDAKFLEKLLSLEKLKLMHEKSGKISLPKTSFFPRNLKRLTLRKTSLQWSDMSTLAKIEKLEVLKLKQGAFVGIQWTVHDVFPSLQFLLVDDADLVIWEASAKHFPSLTCLSIKKCQKLKEIPLELAKNLQRLDIDFLRKSATESARAIQERKKKDQEHEQKVRWGVGFQLSVGSGCES